MLCIYPDRPTWLARRAGRMTGTRVAAALGFHPYQTPLQTYHDFRGELGLGPRQPEVEVTPRMRRGLHLQSGIGAWYAEETGREVMPAPPWALAVHAEHGELAASLDLYQWEQPPVRGRGLLEIKSTSHWSASRWADEAPLEATCQLYWQMACMGAESGAWGTVAGDVGGEMVYHDVERDEEMIALLVRGGRQFLAAVRRGDPPAARAADLGLLNRLAGDKGPTIMLPSEAVDLHAQIETAKGAAKDAEAVASDCKARLAVLLGEAACGVIPGEGVAWRRKLVERHAKACPVCGHAEPPILYIDFRACKAPKGF